MGKVPAITVKNRLRIDPVALHKVYPEQPAPEVRKRGNPDFQSWNPSQADRNTIESMSGVGIPQDKIAAVFEVSKKTLLKYCRKELETAETIANASVGRFLYDGATGKTRDANGNLKHIGVTPAGITAAIFWLKTRAGWRETMVHENVGKDGAAIELNARIIDARQRNIELVEAISKRVAGGIVGNASGEGEDSGDHEPDGG